MFLKRAGFVVLFALAAFLFLAAANDIAAGEQNIEAEVVTLVVIGVAAGIGLLLRFRRRGV